MLSPYIRQDEFLSDGEADQGILLAENTKGRKGDITATSSHLAPLDCRELVSLAQDDAADPDRSHKQVLIDATLLEKHNLELVLFL